MYFSVDIQKFLLTRPLRDVTFAKTIALSHPIISTHTPLTGRDETVYHTFNDQEISTHTPLTGRDVPFLKQRTNVVFISTHTPLTGRDAIMYAMHRIFEISTHTPLTGRDERKFMHLSNCHTFLLTRPLRDVTTWQKKTYRDPHFYSHAPYGT